MKPQAVPLLHEGAGFIAQHLKRPQNGEVFRGPENFSVVLPINPF